MGEFRVGELRERALAKLLVAAVLRRDRFDEIPRHVLARVLGHLRRHLVEPSVLVRENSVVTGIALVFDREHIAGLIDVEAYPESHRRLRQIGKRGKWLILAGPLGGKSFRLV